MEQLVRSGSEDLPVREDVQSTPPGSIAAPPTRTPRLPVIERGELWLLAAPADGTELTNLELGALTAANVIVYDRSLAEIVADILPLGGYAEMACGDGVRRCIEFARDGWSVVRLLDPAVVQQSALDRPTAWSAELQAAGAPGSLKVRHFTSAGGSRISQAETCLREMHSVSAETFSIRRGAIAFAAFSSQEAGSSRWIMSNGVAG